MRERREQVGMTDKAISGTALNADGATGRNSAVLNWLLRSKGKGLNSIPIRFALMSAVMTAAALTLGHWSQLIAHAEASMLEVVACVTLLAAVPSLITFLAATKLANTIQALRTSTDAIVAGDMNSPLDVDCACEVGGLADSFRAMVSRLNHNILRMNILAYTDPVTKLPNRAVINHALSVMAESQCPASVMFIDLDGFKQVNDTLGHETGDELLRQVSDRILEGGFETSRADTDDCTTTFGELCRTCPDNLVFARFAGDEFVAVIPGSAQRSELEARARQIIAAVSSPYFLKGTEVRLSASIGVARAPVDTDDHEELLNFADLAMYAAKQAGKARTRFFDLKLRQVAIEHARTESELRHAIENDELVLHFQPKVDARDYSLTGVEALARWQHPERGLVPPNEFIGIAEKRGLMPELGNCVLHLAVKQARQWMEANQALPIAINISPAQFDRPHLVSEVLGTLEDYRVDPSLLEVEITESMVMSDFAGTRYRLKQLRDAGVRISIDDFGTGFSNLSQLAQLPCDVLKIDRSLIAEVGRDEKSEAIVEAIVHMAKALGHKVVAEGIESTVQLEFLTRIGCDRLQGHLFGTAMTEDELAGWNSKRALAPARGAIEMLRERIEATNA